MFQRAVCRRAGTGCDTGDEGGALAETDGGDEVVQVVDSGLELGGAYAEVAGGVAVTTAYAGERYRMGELDGEGVFGP